MIRSVLDYTSVFRRRDITCPSLLLLLSSTSTTADPDPIIIIIIPHLYRAFLEKGQHGQACSINVIAAGVHWRCRRTVDDQLHLSFLFRAGTASHHDDHPRSLFSRGPANISLAFSPLVRASLAFPSIHIANQESTRSHHRRAVKSVPDLQSTLERAVTPQGNIWRAQHSTGTFSVRRRAPNHRQHA